MVTEVKNRMRWNKIDELIIEGNYHKGRNCIAKSEGREYKFYIKFGDNAEIETFKEIK